MAAKPGMRARRVAEGVREEVASLVARELHDPRVAGAVVTAVDMTPDLRSARVRVKLLEGGEDETRRRDLVKALTVASGFLRREVGRRLGLRNAPDLRFGYDEGADRAARVEQLLSEIERERESR